MRVTVLNHRFRVRYTKEAILFTRIDSNLLFLNVGVERFVVSSEDAVALPVFRVSYADEPYQG